MNGCCKGDYHYPAHQELIYVAPQIVEAEGLMGCHRNCCVRVQSKKTWKRSVGMNEQLERNKQTVTAFYDLMFNQCQPAEAMERYAGGVYMVNDLKVRTKMLD